LVQSSRLYPRALPSPVPFIPRHTCRALPLPGNLPDERSGPDFPDFPVRPPIPFSSPCAGEELCSIGLPVAVRRTPPGWGYLRGGWGFQKRKPAHPCESFLKMHYGNSAFTLLLFSFRFHATSFLFRTAV